MTAATESLMRVGAAPMGGFFETHVPDAVGGGSLLEAWTEGRSYAGYVNARSAFAALVDSFSGATVWLPAFLCRDMLHEAWADRARFFPMREGFTLDLDGVEREAAAGDLVVVPAWFGLPAREDVHAFAQRRQDLRLVEDRAQALDAGRGIAGTWRLFSPRKLLGVADGGLLVAPSADAPPPQPRSAADAAALWIAPNLRAADLDGRESHAWHAANQAKERAMAVTTEAMTPQTLSILSRTSLSSLAEPRLRNWRILDRRLRRWSALPADPGAAPLGYVLRLPPDVRNQLLRALHAERVFAAVHWPSIAAPAERFSREHAWTRELITLPCDHRYGEAAMDRLGARVAQLLA